MTSQEDTAITMLRRIGTQLDFILERLTLATRKPLGNKASAWRLRRAKEIAEMTPESIPQTNSIELLRQDRAR